MSDPRFKVFEVSSLKMEDGAKELLSSPEMQPYGRYIEAAMFGRDYLPFHEQLQRENERLTEQLRKAEIVIDIPKKVAMLLGRSVWERLRDETRRKSAFIVSGAQARLSAGLPAPGPSPPPRSGSSPRVCHQRSRLPRYDALSGPEP
jgi:hypothetical protein